MTIFRNNNLDRRKALIAATGITAVYILIFVLRGAFFETNDDGAIVRVLTQGKNSYAPFLGRILSWFLYVLYALIPFINHWTVLTYLFVGVGLGALVYAIFVRYHLQRAILTNAFLMVVVWQACLSAMNFTRTAMIVAVGGTALIVNAVFLQEKLHKIEFGIGVGLFLLSAQIRFQCTLIALAFLGLLTAICLLKDHFRFEKAWFRAHMKTIVTMLLVAVTVLSSSVVNTLLLTEEQRAYERYNAARAQIQDYPGNYEYNNWDAYAEQTGVSKEDLAMFLSWTSEDTEVFTLEKIEKLGSVKQRSSNASAIGAVAKTNCMVLALAVLFCLGVLLHKPKKLWVPMAAILLLTLAVLFYLAYSGRLPNRVFMSIVLCALAAVALVDSDPACDGDAYKKAWRNKSRTFIAAVLLVASATSAFGYVAFDIVKNGAVGQRPFEKNEYAQWLREDVYNEMNAREDFVYLMPVWSTFNSISYARGPWEGMSRDFCDNLFFLGGWDARMPHKIELLKERGIDNPMRALYQDSRVYSMYDLGLLKYLKRHYDADMTASGVSGRASFFECTLVQYCVPIDPSAMEQSDVTVTFEKLHYEKRDHTDAWYIQGYLSEYPDSLKCMYVNVVLDGKEYTYRLGMHDLTFFSYLYNIPESRALEEAELCFIMEFYDGSFKKIDLNCD